jgi:hypothetical protein
MADDIVGGLFGVNPDMYQQQQQQQVFNRAVALQNLDPFQQAAVGLQQAGYNLGGALGGAMGGVDPQLQRISTLNAISKQIDQSNPESMLRGAKMLSEAGLPQEALALSQYAREASAKLATASKSKAEAEKIQYGQQMDEKLRVALGELGEDATEADVVRVVAQYGSPDKVLSIIQGSQDKAAAREITLTVARENIQGRLDVAQQAAEAKGEAAKTAAEAKVEAAKTAAAAQVEAATKQAESRVEAAKTAAQAKIDAAIQRGEDSKVIAQMTLDSKNSIAALMASTKSDIAQAQIDGRAAVSEANNSTKAAIAAADNSTKAEIAKAQIESRAALAKIEAGIGAGNRELKGQLLQLQIEKLKSDNKNKPMATSLQRDEIKDLESIDSLKTQVDSLAPALKSLKADPKTGKAPLELGPINNLRYQAAAATGSSTTESRAYADLQRAVQSAVNIKTSAEKGVQTDNDVLRFANELTAAFGRNDTKTTLEALSNFSKAAEKAQENTLRKIEQRRASAGAEPFAPVGTPAAVVPTKRWNPQTNRLEEVK